MENETKAILSPEALWKSFSPNKPLQESKVGEESFENIVYSEMYFSGRETKDEGTERVRIYGVYARNKEVKKKSKKAGLLIIPDYTETVDLSIINIYAKQGYYVLMIDYRGEWEGVENYTKYPESISYANYKKAGRHFDHADKSAKETSWFEWVAAARYAVTFLKSQIELEKIGVIGIKGGADIGWMLCGTDKRVDCFIPLFGAGWRAYKGSYKYEEADFTLLMPDEQLRYIAGADAQSYAQYVKCPLFYMTASNSADFDSDRAIDTLTRVGKSGALLNFSPRMRNVLDLKCKRNIDLFLAKYLYGYTVNLPELPKVSIECMDRTVKVNVKISFSDILRPKKVTAYLAEDSKNPACRDWVEMKAVKSGTEKSLVFMSSIHGNSDFVNVFAVAEYKNGITVSSLMVPQRIPNIRTRKLNLLYSSENKTSSFTAVEKVGLPSPLFFEDPAPLEIVEGACGINGICSGYGLLIYKFNDRTFALSENAIIKFDINVPEYCILKLTIVCNDEGVDKDYTYTMGVKAGDIWQNVMIKCSDFKSSSLTSIKNYSSVVALKMESDAKCIFNNILVV